MGVSWIEVKPVELKDRVKSVDVGGRQLLEHLPISKDSTNMIIPHESVNIVFDVRRLLAPLGHFGKTLFNEEEFGELRSSLVKLWSLDKEPVLKYDVVEVDTIEGLRQVVLKSDLVKNKEVVKSNRFREFVAGVKLDKIKDVFDRVRIGGDGHNVEFQFLTGALRKEVKAKKGELLDPGIFVRINGSMQVAAGLNQLVCTNGLTRRMNVWESSTFEFLTDSDMLKRSVELVEWFSKKAEQPVELVREILVVLSTVYSSSFLNRFWKSWSSCIELRTLTWFDVISDLTQATNNSLGSIRYKAMQVSERLMKVQQDRSCPTCSSVVEALPTL